MDKKKALKKILNEKTLLEMSGGGDLDSAYTNIPGDVTLNGTPVTVKSLLDRHTGIITEFDELRKSLGGNTLSSSISQLDVSTYNKPGALPDYIDKKKTPVTPKELTDNGVIGFPLYIADQIAKSTGSTDPILPTGITPDSIKTNGLSSVDYITDNDIDELKGKQNNGINRYLTLYDLITNDDGKFLSSDVDFILNRFSSLAQFKHLPALQYLAMGGGSKSNATSKKNKSRKIRK